MASIRVPAVAGAFYPADGGELRAAVADYLRAVKVTMSAAPKAIIVPHAGYVYSGPVAASAYAEAGKARAVITRVVMVGPAHTGAWPGLAASSAEGFVTPLGVVPVDVGAVAHALRYAQARVRDGAHAREHSLEVQLPFLQVVLETFTIVPLLVGDAGPEEVGEVIEGLWGGAETLVLVSTDLSHYHDYKAARRLDHATSRAIEALEPEKILYEHACGRNPLNGLLRVARRKGLRVRTVDLRNSGDTAGPRDGVVGYGAFVVEEAHLQAAEKKD